MTTGPDFERFKELAAAYGASRNQWPEASRALFDRYGSTPEAQLVLAGAQQVDQFLNQWQPDTREAEIANRILYALPPQARHSLRAEQLRQWSLPAAVLMLFALLGFGNGYFSIDSEFAGRDMPAAFGMVEEE